MNLQLGLTASIIAGLFVTGGSQAVVRQKPLIGRAPVKVDPLGVVAYDKVAAVLREPNYSQASLVEFLQNNPDYPELTAMVDAAKPLTGVAILTGSLFASEGTNPRCFDSVALTGANCKTVCLAVTDNPGKVEVTNSFITPDRDAKFVDFTLIEGESGARVCAKIKSWALGEERKFSFTISVEQRSK